MNRQLNASAVRPQWRKRHRQYLQRPTLATLGFHRHRVGRQPGAVTISVAKSLGFRILRAVIRADITQAIRFYESLGFRVLSVDKTSVTSAGDSVDRIHTEMNLGYQ